MQRNTLFAALVAAAFAFPLAANAGGKDKHASSANGANDGGASAMFKSLDKNKDGYISKDEAKGSPHDKDFAKLDKNSDNKLSRDEHAAAPEHAGEKRAPAAGGSTSGSQGKGSKY